MWQLNAFNLYPADQMDEQRPRNRKCRLCGIVNRPGKLEKRLPRDMKTLDKKWGEGSSWESVSPRCPGYGEKPLN